MEEIDASLNSNFIDKVHLNAVALIGLEPAFWIFFMAVQNAVENGVNVAQDQRLLPGFSRGQCLAAASTFSWAVNNDSNIHQRKDKNWNINETTAKLSFISSDLQQRIQPKMSFAATFSISSTIYICLTTSDLDEVWSPSYFRNVWTVQESLN